MKTDDQTLIEALRILAHEFQSEDGVANACIAEGANRLAELKERIAKLEDALKSIATQPKSNEWEQEGDTEHGYDTIIDRAREALKDDK
jgi:hypothetical protein